MHANEENVSFLLFPVVPVLLNEHSELSKSSIFGPINQLLKVAPIVVVVREFHLFGDKGKNDQ